MLGGLDLLVFFGALVLVMTVGLLAARGEEDSDDYFLAGRSIPWWGVAGSIFGTNVSANHLVGMLGIGFSIGFAQSHYELGAVFGLLMLAYVLLPVYARLRVTTLSEYLGGRYDARASLLYAATTVILIVVHMTALFYIGSRSLGLLLDESVIDLGYVGGILALALVSGAYTIVGGLKAVVWTDVIQSALLLVAGGTVAWLTFAQLEIGGFTGLLALDAALPVEEQRMHLMLPADHPQLPWSGALTGLMVLHLSFWGTNQYIVQRALAARTLTHARVGILAGGFLKLLVPFFSVAGGVAAGHLFEARLAGTTVAPDEAFPVLMQLVLPAGYGLLGLVAAGLLGAILSTIDSMMNSGATLIAIDLYRAHLRPDASDRALIRVGRIAMAALGALAAGLAATVYDPNSQGNFFLTVSRQLSYLTPGLVVAFVMGMLSARVTARGALAAILAAPAIGLGLEAGWDAWADAVGLTATFGPSLNFLHRTLLTTLACAAIHAAVSRTGRAADASAVAPFLLVGQPEPMAPRRRAWLARIAAWTLGLAGVAAGLAADLFAHRAAAGFGALWTFAAFAWHVHRDTRASREQPLRVADDRLLAGLLCAATIGLLFLFA